MRRVTLVTMMAAVFAGAVAAAPLTRGRALAVMHERHEGMEAIGDSNKSLRRELAASSPDLTVVRLSAGRIAQLSRKASAWFPRGTGPDVGKTGAKPGIWQNPRDFGAKLAAFQKAALALQGATSGNDVSAMKARYSDLMGTCKACHDTYRTEMHH